MIRQIIGTRKEPTIILLDNIILNWILMTYCYTLKIETSLNSRKISFWFLFSIDGDVINTEISNNQNAENKGQ